MYTNKEDELNRVLVCGAGGFIGSHLVKRLKKEGYWVRGVDLKKPEFSKTEADEFLNLDLREEKNCEDALSLKQENFDEVYQLAADMGGMGYIHSAECDIMRNNALININMLYVASKLKIKRYFFSSSVCVYRDMKPEEPELFEEDAYPALPHNEYGWEKLYAERLALTFSRKYDMQIRIARFQNCYGPECTWRGGREKAPAALCRKVAEIDNNGTIEVWGDGSAIRSFIYIDDLIEGILCLMNSDLKGPVNIGSPEYVTVDELAYTIAEVAGKKIHIKHVVGPVGVLSRNFSNSKIYTTGFRPKYSLKYGIAKTYPWIEKRVKDKLNK